MGVGNREIGRRAFLGGVGAGAGLLLAGGTGGLPRWLGGGRAYKDLGHAACLARLDASLTPRQRELTVRPWDHPSRQITNTVSIFKGPHIGTLFDADQRALVWRLYETMLSRQGRDWFRNTITLEGRLEGSVLAIFSDEAPGDLARDPKLARTQTMLTGGHLMLRKGGVAASGYAFGGPISYGQQIGNGEFKVRGNAFAVHSDAANRFYESLSEGEREMSRVAAPPNELMVQPQGPYGRFSGIRVGAASGAAREQATELLDTVLATYKPSVRADAYAAIDENGGLDALYVSFFENKGFYEDVSIYADLSDAERRARELPYWQVWRIEGPGCVAHFKGSPHVHAYIDIVRDPARQNIGEVLTQAGSPLPPGQVRNMMLATLRHATAEAVAYYPEDPPARVCAGDVTTGLVHALAPYQDAIVVATIRGAAMADGVRATLAAQGVRVDDGKMYRVATLEYPASRSDLFGDPEQVDPWPTDLRDALVAFLRDRDLAAFHG